MHATLIQRFPRLGALWDRSDTTAPDNYFGIYGSPILDPGAEKQFLDWENLLQELDPISLGIFLRKAAGRVSANDPARGWTQLVECINEVRGYHLAKPSDTPRSDF
jgi:hypothetical protein